MSDNFSIDFNAATGSSGSINIAPGTLAFPVTWSTGTPAPAEVAEKIRSGSMGGHDPEADMKPVRTLVRTFGKWADGRFSKCRTILSKKPELVAAGGGNVNRLCAWLKDQWLGSTKWRGNKARDLAMIAAKKASDAAEAAAILESNASGETFTILIPEWMTDDFESFFAELTQFFQDEMEREEKEGYEPGMERDKPDAKYDGVGDGPEWDDDNDILDGDHDDADANDGLDDNPNDGLEDSAKVDGQPVATGSTNTSTASVAASESDLSGGCGCEESDLRSPETREAHAVSFEDLTTKIRTAIRSKYTPEARDNELIAPSRGYVWVKETFDDHVIFEYSPYGEDKQCLYRQDYSVDASGEVQLNGDAQKVMVEYVPVKTSDEYSSEAGSDTEEAPDGESSTQDDSPSADTEVETEPTRAPLPDGFQWVLVRNGNITQTALIDKNHRIIRGPRHIVGKKLPSIPKRVAVTTESGPDPDVPNGPSNKTGVSGTTQENLGDCIRKHISEGKSFVEARNACLSGAGKTKGVIAEELLQNPVKQGGRADEVGEAQEGEALLEVGESDVIIDEMTADLGAGIVSIAESQTSTEKPTSPSGKEYDAIIRVIRPGPGNPADGFYYRPEVIQRDIKVIAEGLKMYKDHLSPEEEKKLGGRVRSVDDWAAFIGEAWTDSDGNGFGGVTFVDEAFHQKAKKGHQHLGVSIRARAKVKPGQVDGKNYRVVEGFIQGRSVDFVTEAGAGGGFVSVAESLGGSMAKFEGTLDELKGDRPDLVDAIRQETESAVYEHLAQEGLENEAAADTSTDGADTSKETSESVEDGLPKTRAELDALLEDAVSRAVAAAKAADETTEAQREQRAILDGMLLHSPLRDASKEKIRGELFDVVYADKVSESGEVIESGADQFKAHAKRLIDDKVAELSEYLKVPRASRVVDLGPGTPVETSEASSEESKGPRGWDPNAEIDRLTASSVSAK